MELDTFLQIAFGFLIGVMVSYPQAVVITLKNLKRDLSILLFFARLAITLILSIVKSRTIPKRFNELVNKNPNKIAFYYEDTKWTFRQVDEFSNRVGNYFKKQGYRRGDSVALLYDSKPEFICLWLGLSKIGVTTALLNNNLVSEEAFAHALKCGRTKSIIYGSKYDSVIKRGLKHIQGLKAYYYSDPEESNVTESINLSKEIKNSSSDYIKDIENGKIFDHLVYIFTSGTTGLPKASIISNFRFSLIVSVFNNTIITEDDIIYTSVPLYHTLGGIAGAGQVLLTGSSVVVRSKFSASNFWKDIQKYKCTAAQYIGEMSRYILTAHQQNNEEIKYVLPKMYGNGMKAETWKQFVKKFNVGRIFEFYGSTEGNFGFFNLNNKIGSVGYMPILAEIFSPHCLVKCDAMGNPIKNRKGFFSYAETDEPGLLICRIGTTILTKFDGYSDKEATEKKILKNVFKNGDNYFNTGDIFTRDVNGYYYFRDRTGDTFRWKGENVSTSEVEDSLSLILGEKDIAVYGVEIPGNEGKAGMAAIADPERTVDLKRLYEGATSKLPSYSIPIFIRLVDSLPKTGTYKLQKVKLQKDGYDINKITDNLYVLDTVQKKYVELSEDIYDKIASAKLRL